MIPNVITPNNDGVNDKFIVPNNGHIGSLNLQVYNRWGILVYQKDNYDNSWSPSQLDDGTYFYIIDATNDIYKGYLTIFK